MSVAEAESSTALPQTKGEEITVFLCYRRSDGSWYAEWINKALDGLSYTNAQGKVLRVKTYYDRTAPAVPDWKAHHFPSLQSSHALIVICTPGIAKDLSRSDEPDWVYEEIRWWIANRRFPPIVVETTGEGARWLPDPIAHRWENLNRLDLRRTEAERETAEASDSYLQRWRERVLRSIRESEETTTFEEAERLKKLNGRLKLSLYALVAAIVAALAFAWNATINADNAEREARTSDASVRFLADLFANADPDHTFGQALSAVQVLRTGTATVELSSLPASARAQLLHAIGDAYTGLGEPKTALQLLEKAEALVQRDTSDERLLRLRLSIAEALLYSEEYESAAAQLLEAQRLSERTSGSDTATRSAILVAQGDLHTWAPDADFEKARRLYSQALALDAASDRRLDVARDHARIGYLEFSSGNYEEASKAYLLAIETARAQTGNDSLLVAQHEHDYAAVLYDIGRLDDAHDLFKLALSRFQAIYGADSPHAANAQNNLGRTLIELGRIDEARPLLSSAVRVQESEMGPDFYQLAFSANNLALTEMEGGNPDVARKLLQRAQRISDKNGILIGAQSLVHEAETYMAQSNYSRAAILLDAAQKQFASHGVTDGWRYALYQSAKGELEARLCNLTEASSHLTHSRRALSARWPTQSNIFTTADARRQHLLAQQRTRERCLIDAPG